MTTEVIFSKRIKRWKTVLKELKVLLKTWIYKSKKIGNSKNMK